MDFNGAAMALVDEDQEEAILEFFDVQADFYCGKRGFSLTFIPAVRTRCLRPFESRPVFRHGFPNP